jgi:hypothetical protein
VLADLLRGGVLLVIADPAGAPMARVLIQPDADILLSVNRGRVLDPALGTRLREEQQTINAWLAAATRPLDTMWTLTHVPFAVGYATLAREVAVTFEYWLAQTAAAACVVLLGMLSGAVLRRFALRWLLRHL